MAKGKYQNWITDDGLIKLEGYARDGLTDEEIAGKIGIRRETLYAWMKKYPNISNALKRGKEVIDYEVEQALLKKSLGYTIDLKKTFKVKRSIYDKNTGKKIKEYEELVTGYDQMHVPPDTTAQIFWLKNRQPEKWRDKRDVEHSGNINNPMEGLSTADLKKLIKDGG